MCLKAAWVNSIQPLNEFIEESRLHMRRSVTLRYASSSLAAKSQIKKSTQS